MRQVIISDQLLPFGNSWCQQPSDNNRYAANQEHRSVANMVEMMIRQYCRDAGYPVLEQTPLFDDEQ